LVVAEAALNVACAGARPVALVNCLNFGNPEHTEVMWQLSEAVDGMAEAARALDVPVVGGNVSLYNESRGRDIDPTPVVGMVGLIDSLERRPPGAGLIEGGRLLLVGDADARSLAGSAWAGLRGHLGGELPPVDYDRHRAVLDLVRGLVVDGILAGVHDVSEGGLGVALAEMAFASDVGFRVTGVDDHGQLFSEAPSRAVVCVTPERAPEVLRRASAAGVPATLLGGSGGDRLVVDGLFDLSLAEARSRWQSAVPEAVAP
jgi:phosphoribosylformylglycinamidine synthase